MFVKFNSQNSREAGERESINSDALVLGEGFKVFEYFLSASFKYELCY